MGRSPKSTFVAAVVEGAVGALEPLRDGDRAEQMAAYMKQIAPFLGIPADDRRRALKGGWVSLSAPTSDELGDAARALMALREREYHYAAYDLIERFRDQADEYFLDRYVTQLLTTTPWWDTVDGLVTAAVSPLMCEFAASWLVEEWSHSGDRWLVRAAITHQRGWKLDTDASFVLALCDRHWSDSEFFVAKAIGWVLRHIARFDPRAVEHFLSQHLANNRVAVREAERGLNRFAR